jgi:hypothetical protein
MVMTSSMQKKLHIHALIVRLASEYDAIANFPQEGV